MSKVLFLAISFLREHPTRVWLTSLATIASTCMVIWMASGYDALIRTFDEYANLALGRYELSIAPISTDGEHSVPDEVVKVMRADASVAAADPMWLLKAKLRAANPSKTPPTENKSQGKNKDGSRLSVGEGPGTGPGGRRSEFNILAVTSTEPPFDLEGQWIDVNSADDNTVALRKDVAERLGIAVGDEILLLQEETTRLRVVGLLVAPSLGGAGAYGVPQMLTPSTGEVYMSVPLAERLFNKKAEHSFLAIAVKPDADITKFRFGWAPRLNRYATPVQFQEAFEIEEALDQSAAADNVQMQAYAATGIAMLVALLVIFCTLSMGVTERLRQFAVLRAVVLTRMQLSTLIILEGLLLAAIGYIAGVIVSWGLLQIVARSTRLLHHGADVGFHSLLLAGVAAFGGALLAALLPAYRATRVRPIDAMSPRVQTPGTFVLPIPLIVLGVILILVNPVLTFVFPPRFESQVTLTLAIGFICMAIGFVLLTPAVVAIVDRWFGPILARLLRIDPKLLASQITSHLWRSVGASISLAFGMGLFIGVQVWGFTMLDAFVPGPWCPDAMIAFRPAGMDPQAAAKVANFAGVDPQRALPIVVEQPRFLNDVTHSADRASVTRQDNIVIVGIDAAKAFGGATPLFDLEWVESTPQVAIPKMREGRGCLVPDHFLTESGLRVGDSFELVPPEDPTKPVKYTIAGAVRLPGWHWQTKMTGFRSRTHRAAALVFADYEPVAKDFHLPNSTHVWFAYDSQQADPDKIAKEAQALYAQVLMRDVAIGNAPEGEPSVRVMPVEDIRRMTYGAARRWIWAISQLPLLALVIACLGVLNVILASVRARRWEMGVLRAIGITKGEIVRAIIAEGIMIGIVACIVSLSFGIMAGWCGCGIAQYISFFGGLHPSLVIPWLSVSAGLLFVLTLGALSASWPAFSIGRLRPLSLLQEGRGTF